MNCSQDSDMKTVDGAVFWMNVDAILSDRKTTLREFCASTGISYSTISTQRVRHSIPKLEQLLEMGQALNTSIEKLIYGSDYEEDRIVFPARVMTIAMRCITASNEDLTLVERILRIEPDDGEKSSASGAFA